MAPKKEFWSQVQKSDSCWLWTGSTKGKGWRLYGSVWFRRRHDIAHRVAWILTHGEIPVIDGADVRGTCVLHHCDTPLCVRPDHLFLGTHLDNMKDKCAKRRDTEKWKTHCKHGHPRNEVNTWLDPKRGLKHCRVCSKLRMRRVYALRRNVR